MPHTAFEVADVGDAVPVRGPDSALSPIAEPFTYVVVYEAVLRLLASTGLPVVRNWAPVLRPYQGAQADQRIKMLQPFRVGKLVSVGEANDATAGGRVGFGPALTRAEHQNPMYARSHA